ncbi:DUF2892 domain-containing protein [Myxococcota bacterium]|nr:DUF2892 domain-containing protein [Myxococcota bacterium]
MDLARLLPKNEHPIERVVRVLLGVGLLSLLAVGPVPGWGLAGLIGIVPIFTGAVGSCPAYTLFGFSTCPTKTKTES